MTAEVVFGTRGAWHCDDLCSWAAGMACLQVAVALLANCRAHGMGEGAGAQMASPVHGLSAPSQAASGRRASERESRAEAALSSSLRRGIGFDACGCSVLTALGSGVGSSRQALVPVAATSGVRLLRAESRAGAVHL